MSAYAIIRTSKVNYTWRTQMAESLPEVGQPAPDFTATAHAGETISLKYFEGNQNVVLFFYPKADTPGCTLEACSFRDHLERFKAKDTAVLGISADTVKK